MNSTQSNPPDERSALFDAVADDSLTSEQERQLADFLRTDAAFRREYVHFCEFLAQLTWESSASHQRQQLPVTPADENTVLAPRPTTIHHRTTFRFWSGVAVVVVIAIVFSFIRLGPFRSGAASPGIIIKVAGQVQLLRDGESPISIHMQDLARVPFPLRTDDRIQTDGTGYATVTLADRTEIRIRPASQLILNGKPEARLTVPYGSVEARVTPQPKGRELTILTPLSRVSVLGTEFELLALKERTEVAVTKGEVRVTRTADDVWANVAAPQFLRVAQSGPLDVVNWPRAADDWSEGFENGPPPGWTGRFVREDLPSGSRGALQAVTVSDTHGRRTEVSSPIEEQGLFAWHDDSELRVKFKVQPPAWFHVYIFTRPYERTKPEMSWSRVSPELWQIRPGDWQTVSIPLSEFHPTSVDSSEAMLGRIPMRLAFVGPGDLVGVAIDSIRVSRSGIP